MTRRNMRCGRGGRIESLEPRRLLAAAGSLDTSFSGDGKATLSTTDALTANDVALQADGKTVVVGRSTLNNAGTVTVQFAVARFNVDGSPDASFAVGGVARVQLSPVSGSFAQAVAIAPDGKIVVVGSAVMSGNVNDTDIAVVRYHPNGSLDTSFSGDGKLTMDLNESETAGSKAHDVAVEPDGQIVIVGQSFDGQTDDCFATRLNVDGSSNGTRFFEFGANDIAEAVKIAGDGKVVVAATVVSERTVNDPVVQRVGLTRFTPGGPADYQTLFTVPGSPSVVVADLILQPGGKVVITGVTNTGSSRDVYVARFTNTGVLDTTFGALGTRDDGTFGPTGFHTTNLGGFSVSVAGITHTPGGNGFIVSGSSDGSIVAVKYTDDGALDPAFGAGGVARVPGFGSTASIAPGPGLRVTLAGGDGFATARLLLGGANVVTAGATDTLAIEGTTNTGKLFVGRTERLPFETKVFIGITGTTAIGSGRGGARDWSMPGLVIPLLGSPYVTIPANETFVELTFSTVNDSLIEGTEFATFTILANGQYEVGTSGSGRIDIRDDDTLDVVESRVGTTTATLPPKQVGVGQELQAAVTWTVPSGGWRQLSTIQLRLRNRHDDDALAILTFDEATNSFSVESTPGADNAVSLVLSKCVVQADGPTAPTVTVIFTFAFNAVAARERFRLDVAATNDAGDFSGFAQIGELHVHKKRKDDGPFLPL